LAFSVFGFLYIGLVQWFLYITVLTWLFPDAMVFANSPMQVKLTDGVGQLNVLGQVLVDNLVFCALVYFPVFYTLKELMQGGGSMRSRVQTGVGKYVTNFVSDNLASLALWVPADIFIFAAPMFLRMPLEHATSFFWTMFMSACRGAMSSELSVNKVMS